MSGGVPVRASYGEIVLSELVDGYVLFRYAACFAARGHIDLCSLDGRRSLRNVDVMVCMMRSHLPFCGEHSGDDQSCLMPAASNSSAIASPLNAPPPSLLIISTSWYECDR